MNAVKEKCRQLEELISEDRLVKEGSLEKVTSEVQRRVSIN